MLVPFRHVDSICRTFKNDQKIVFLGDSNIHYGMWWSYIWAYYITRFPDRKLVFANAGVSGDTATEALRRLEEIVLDREPDQVCVIMFGMNDVRRNLYEASPTPEALKAQNAALVRYQRSLEKMLMRLTDAGIPVVVVAPPPYDQGMVSPEVQSNQPGCNEGLGRAAAIAKELATKYDCELVDFYGPMTAILETIQKTTPESTIIGPDRIHPQSKGSWIMAWVFLKAQRAPRTVARMTVDFQTNTVTELTNAAAHITERTDDGLILSYHPRTLPLPVVGAYEKAAELVPLTSELNEETIQVLNLQDETYELSLNDSLIGVFASEELSRGINMATLQSNPNQKQAQKVYKSLSAVVETTRIFQDMVFLKMWLSKQKSLDPNNIPKMKGFLQKEYQATTSTEQARVASYVAWRGREGELTTDLEKQIRKTYELSQPVSETVSLKRVPK